MSLTEFTAIGLDVGGTKIAGGVVSFPDGIVRIQHTIPTLPARGGAPVLADLERLAQRLAAEALGARIEVRGLGLGLCELVAPDGGILSANCIDWRNQPVRERLSLIAPLTVEADVRAAALAEAQFGAGQPFRQFLHVTVGTGIASCLVIDRVPFAGARGAAGTMASSPLSVRCERCGETSRSTLEEVAAGPGLVARYNQFHPDGARGGQDVLAAAATGDAEALFVARSGGEALGASVAWLVNVLDPEAVIVGGGLGLSEGPYWESFVDSTRRHIWSGVHRDLPILRAATGPNAGLIGAAAAAWKRCTP